MQQIVCQYLHMQYLGMLFSLVRVNCLEGASIFYKIRYFYTHPDKVGFVYAFNFQYVIFSNSFSHSPL